MTLLKSHIASSSTLACLLIEIYHDSTDRCNATDHIFACMIKEFYEKCGCTEGVGEVIKSVEGHFPASHKAILSAGRPWPGDDASFEGAAERTCHPALALHPQVCCSIPGQRLASIASQTAR